MNVNLRNKNTIIISAISVLIVSAFIFSQYQIKQEIRKQGELMRDTIFVLQDMRMMEAPIMAADAGLHSRGQMRLSGEVLSPGMKDNLFKIRVFAQEEGPFFDPEIPIVPDVPQDFELPYFTKGIIVDQDTEIKIAVLQPDIVELKKLTPFELEEKINLSLERGIPIFLDVIARQPFVIGQDSLITADRVYNVVF